MFGSVPNPRVRGLSRVFEVRGVWLVDREGSGCVVDAAVSMVTEVQPSRR